MNREEEVAIRLMGKAPICRYCENHRPKQSPFCFKEMMNRRAMDSFEGTPCPGFSLLRPRGEIPDHD